VVWQQGPIGVDRGQFWVYNLAIGRLSAILCAFNRKSFVFKGWIGIQNPVMAT